MNSPAFAASGLGRDELLRMAAWSAAVLAVIATLAAAKAASAIVAPTVLAGLFALTLAPLVAAAERRGVPGTLAAGGLVGLCITGLAGAAYLLAPSAEQWRLRAPSIVRAMERQLRSIEREIKDDVGRSTLGDPSKLEGTESAADAVIDSSQRLITDAVLSAPEVLATLFYTVFLCFFLLAERASLRRFMLSLTPTRRARRNLGRAMRDMRQNVARYLLIISCINLALGAAAALVFWLMGLPNPVLWGAVVAVLNYMPYLGPLASNVLVFVVGMTTFHDAASALWPVLALVALNIAEGQVVTPMTVGQRARVGPLSVFLALAVGAWLWGVLGALVAAPLLIVGDAAARRMLLRPRRPAARLA